MMSWDATRPNFYRRYKWAYKTEYDGIKAVPIASPNFRKFIRICEDIAQDEVHLTLVTHASTEFMFLSDVGYIPSEYDRARASDS